MKKIKQIITNFPEFYFIALFLLIGFKPLFTFSALGMVVAGLLVLQMLVLNRLFGIIMANVFLIANLFMLIAIISELSEFKTFDTSAYKLLIVGSLFWCVNVIFVVLMIRKYMESEKKLPSLIK